MISTPLLIERSLAGRILVAIARNATEIEAREKLANKHTNDNKDDPPPLMALSPPLAWVHILGQEPNSNAITLQIATSHETQSRAA